MIQKIKTNRKPNKRPGADAGWRVLVALNNNTEELCNFLARLQRGEIGRKDALDRLRTLAALKTPGLEELFGNLHHYIADVDIRARDAGYRELQDTEMAKLIARLRTGEVTEANRVTFLEKT